MRNLEKTLENKIKKELKSRGFHVFKICDRFSHGIPDLLGAAPDGRLLAIEVKRKSRPSKTKAALQQYNIDKLKSMGAISYFIDDIDKLKLILEKEKFNVIM